MNAIIAALRNPVTKIVTRIILYGLAAVYAKLGMESNAAGDEAAAIADSLVALGIVGVQALIDYLHHRADLAQPPK